MAAYSTADSTRIMDSGLLSTRNRNESATANGGGAFWSYSSTATEVNVTSTGWFSNAGRLGMVHGDIVFCASYNSTGNAVDFTIGLLGPISTSATGAAELVVNAIIGSS